MCVLEIVEVCIQIHKYLHFQNKSNKSYYVYIFILYCTYVERFFEYANLYFSVIYRFSDGFIILIFGYWSLPILRKRSSTPVISLETPLWKTFYRIQKPQEWIRRESFLPLAETKWNISCVMLLGISFWTL